MSIGLYAGSFDPIHFGHLDVIERAAPQFDRLLVAVADNPTKAHLLSADRRVELVIRSTQHMSNVVCRSHAGLTADLARDENVDSLVRVIGKEARQELVMAAANEVLGVRTAFVAPSPQLATISSTVVRSLVAHGHWDDVRAIVPAPVFEALISLGPA